MIKLDKSKVTRNLGKKYKLVPHLEKAISSFEDEWEFRYQEKADDTYWHPSGHCTEPVSILYDIATGNWEEEPVSTGLRKAFQIGHFWHQWLQYIVLHKLEFCEPDAIERVGMEGWQPHGPYHAVRGSGDVAPCVTPSWKGIVDFKTMNPMNFAKNELPPYFDAKYECQINMYMRLFEEEEAIILAINKENGEFKEFRYHRNDDLIDAIFRKWEFVSAAVDAGERVTKLDDDHWEKLPLTGPVG